MGEKETAFHEAGHCLVGYCRYQNIEYVTIKPKVRDGSERPGHCRWLDTDVLPVRLACRNIAGDIAERILKGETDIHLYNAAIETEATETHKHWVYRMENLSIQGMATNTAL